MYGNGSDGALNVTSGTTNLALNTKHQFTTVDVASGAALSTLATTGSVLYITATTHIKIAGSVLLGNKIAYGNALYSVTIDGITYTSPGVRPGGNGGSNLLSAVGGTQSNGFGGGGAGGSTTTVLGGGVARKGGNGGNGGATAGSGGAYKQNLRQTGNNGGASSGGGGAIDVFGIEGSAYLRSGAGGNAHGSGGGSYAIGGSGAFSGSAGGGGGAGGRAGRPGIHLVLAAPLVEITGTINLEGTSGTIGGNGGGGYPTTDRRGSGGGGGGAGNGGNIYIQSDTYIDTATKVLWGGFSSNGGTGRAAGGIGSAGIEGQVYYTYVPLPEPAEPYEGPFARVWDGDVWKYHRLNIRAAGRWIDRKTKAL